MMLTLTQEFIKYLLVNIWKQNLSNSSHKMQQFNLTEITNANTKNQWEAND